MEQVDWRIPADGQLDLVAALEQLYGPRAADIDAANAEVVRRLDQGVPLLVDIAPAGTVVPGMSGPDAAALRPRHRMGRRLRPAPPLDAGRDRCRGVGRVRRAGRPAARRRRRCELEPAYLHDTVVPMASAIGPSAPVFVVDNRDGGTRAFAPDQPGPGGDRLVRTGDAGGDRPAGVPS